MYGQAILHAWVQSSLTSGGQTAGNGVPEVNEFATTLYRLYVRQRPQSVPIAVDGLTFNHEIVVLPYWAVMESSTKQRGLQGPLR